MTLNIGAVPFASLPAASPATQGMLSGVTDANNNKLGQAITSGGNHFHVLAYCTGTQWIVACAQSYWFSAVADRVNMMEAQPFSTGAQYGAWTLSEITVGTATGVVAPDGTTNPAKLIPSTNPQFHVLQEPTIATDVTQPVPYVASLYARADGQSVFTLQLCDSTGSNNCVSGLFDLNAGACSFVSNTGHWATFGTPLRSGAITPVGNGWYLCQVWGISWFNAGLAMRLVVDSNTPGDGVGGIDVWRANIMPYYGLNLDHIAFFDDFTSASTIDVNNTLGTGFNWYTKNKFTGASSPYTTASPTQPGDISVANSLLTLATDRSGFGEGLNTIADNGAGGFVGQTFNPPFFIESVASFNPANAIGANNPAVSPMPLAVVAKEALISNAQPWLEIDVCKANATGAGTVAPQSTIQEHNTNNTVTNALTKSVVVGSPTFTNLHRYSCLWITFDGNAGIQLNDSFSAGEGSGYILFFFDGVFTGHDMVYYPPGDSFSNVQQPALTPANPVGAVWSGDLQTFSLMLGAGTGWPLTVDSVTLIKSGN